MHKRKNATYHVVNIRRHGRKPPGSVLIVAFTKKLAMKLAEVELGRAPYRILKMTIEIVHEKTLDE